MMFSYRFVKYVFLSLALVFITFITSCSSQPLIDEMTVMPDGTILLVTHHRDGGSYVPRLQQCKVVETATSDLRCQASNITWTSP